MKRIYLDHNATEPLLPVVKNTILKNLDLFGNPSSLHAEGIKARQKIESARSAVATLINAPPSEIIFTSGGTEGNNMVINAFLGNTENLQNSAPPTIAVSAIEHPSILKAAKNAIIIPVDKSGKINLKEYKKILEKSRPALVSIMLANNEIGTIQDIKTLARLAHEQGALFHTDAVQAAGKIPINVKDLDVDFLTLSAHKIGGLKGTGALYIKAGTPLAPLLRGGHQENNKRSGTENTLGIISFGAAAKHANKNLPNYQKLATLRDYLCTEIIKNIEDVTINGSLHARFGNNLFAISAATGEDKATNPATTGARSGRTKGYSERRDTCGGAVAKKILSNGASLLSNTLNISFAGAEGESITLMLDAKGVAVSTGSACASGDGKSSHVLMAIKADPELAHSSVRFSLGLETTKKDLDYTVKTLKEAVEKLRSFSSTGIVK
jgi:cysteine desulfurase